MTLRLPETVTFCLKKCRQNQAGPVIICQQKIHQVWTKLLRKLCFFSIHQCLLPRSIENTHKGILLKIVLVLSHSFIVIKLWIHWLSFYFGFFNLRTIECHTYLPLCIKSSWYKYKINSVVLYIGQSGNTSNLESIFYRCIGLCLVEECQRPLNLLIVDILHVKF